MSFPRAKYRARQFWLALWARPNLEELERAGALLTAPQFELFKQLQSSEQAHALEVYRELAARGEDNQELLAAALLHDAGKVRHPVRLWERVWVVLGKRFFPRQAERWGQGEAVGLARPFVVAAQHPAWGADRVKKAGASPLTVSIIRRHQDENPGDLTNKENRLLAALQAVDDKN